MKSSQLFKSPKTGKFERGIVDFGDKTKVWVPHEAGSFRVVEISDSCVVARVEAAIFKGVWHSGDRYEDLRAERDELLAAVKTLQEGMAFAKRQNAELCQRQRIDDLLFGIRQRVTDNAHHIEESLHALMEELP